MTTIECNCKIQSLCTKCPCEHFDRTVSDRARCPSPCDAVHVYCLDCGEALDECFWDQYDEQ